MQTNHAEINFKTISNSLDDTAASYTDRLQLDLQLVSGRAHMATFTSAVKTRLQSRVWNHCSSKHTTGLPDDGGHTVECKPNSALLWTWAEYGLLPSHEGMVWMQYCAPNLKMFANGPTAEQWILALLISTNNKFSTMTSTIRTPKSDCFRQLQKWALPFCTIDSLINIGVNIVWLLQKNFLFSDTWVNAIITKSSWNSLLFFCAAWKLQNTDTIITRNKSATHSMLTKGISFSSSVDRPAVSLRPYLTEQQQSQSISHESANQTIPDRTTTKSTNQSWVSQSDHTWQNNNKVNQSVTSQPIRPYQTEQQQSQSISHETANQTIPDRTTTKSINQSWAS